MGDIEFRRRRSDDEVEPYYVVIAQHGDPVSWAFTDTTDSAATLEAAIVALRDGEIIADRFYDQGNDKWFFRFRHAESSAVLFRSMPCDDEATMADRIERIMHQARSAPSHDET